ncbi:hypothetical protein BYT27DRAFT_7341028 [Phlegmacium glaucopus]|nr:hypothetical protein BYT27DRAFT_7341028 [Phlegmacium glaucopus]
MKPSSAVGGQKYQLERDLERFSFNQANFNRLIHLPFLRVDAAVFSISPGSLSTVDTGAASHLVLEYHVFLLRYNWADPPNPHCSRSRCLWLLFFLLPLCPSPCPPHGLLRSCRFSRLAPVIAVCILVGVAMSLQFLIFGAH